MNVKQLYKDKTIWSYTGYTWEELIAQREVDKNLDDILNKIEKPSEEAIKESRKRWDSISKPLRSLGLLEEAIIKIAGIQKNSKVDINKKALIVMCADNGVVCENVTQTGMEITALVTENFTKNKTSASVIAGSLYKFFVP